MTSSRKAKKTAQADHDISPGFLRFLRKHLAKQDAQRAAGITNEQALAMRKLDRRTKTTHKRSIHV